VKNRRCSGPLMAQNGPFLTALDIARPERILGKNKSGGKSGGFGNELLAVLPL